jgi:FkbM family methyltransferase
MPATVAHHEVFASYPCFQGDADEGEMLDFLGVRTRAAWWVGWPGPFPRRFERTNYPPFDEEYFEWIDVLTAVREASERFTMIELGAGWGRWLVRAAVALRQTNDIPCRLVAVEAEPTHFQWLCEHLKDNGLDPRRHVLLEAAVGPKDGYVHFLTGNANTSYGQTTIPRPGEPGGPPREPFPKQVHRWVRRLVGREDGLDSRTRRVKCIGLSRLLGKLDRVDLVDADIQGSEADVFASAAAELNRKVGLVHIGTHSAEVEQRLRELFTSLGWERRFDYACGSRTATPWGVIAFGDGVQSWRNPRW